MFKKILIGLAVIIAAILILALFQPSEFKITRQSAPIAAPQAKVFPLVNDFHNWEKWSPWEKLDPNMKRSFEGPASGAGAVYGWEGNSDVGKGKMTILESKPDEYIRIRLEFIEPMSATSETTFVIGKDNSGSTAVEWTMSGHNNYLAKIMCVFMNMEKMIGPDFEKGLAQLKSAAEASAPAAPPAPPSA